MTNLNELRKQKQILHYTPGRSGSAFISQILFHIFEENNVWAGHEPINYKIEPQQKLFITIRDFRDVAASYWRTSNDIPLRALDNGKKMSNQEVVGFFNQIKQQVNNDLIPTYNSNKDAFVFKYKLFFPNKFDYILSNIENHCNITLSKTIKEEIKNTYNLQENKKRSDAAGSFKNLGDKWMHGKHVYKGKIGWWKDVVPPNMHRYINELLAPELKFWNYDI